MILTPRAILALLVDAGFPLVDRGPALALVMACSAGDTLYRDVAYPGPSVDARGLFGLDVVRLPQLADDDLFDPTVNVKAARELLRSSEGSWAWAGCPVPSTSSEAFSEAKAALRAGPRAMTVAESAAVGGLTGQALDNARRLADLSDYVRSSVLTRTGY